ncbi:hypothetical protein ABZ721_39720 [Streptomyces sp. NPDC006733]|uniref:hypothetical protein n=1 Tax=Streptomyces sp. NPDC006733 TaxID=3155460 RepID=UPI00340A4247
MTLTSPAGENLTRTPAEWTDMVKESDSNVRAAADVRGVEVAAVRVQASSGRRLSARGVCTVSGVTPELEATVDD